MAARIWTGVEQRCENIGPAERARRTRVGFAMAIVTLLASAAVIETHADWPWRLALFLPAAASAIGFLQARDRTCVLFVARGIRVMGDSGGGVERVVDPAERAALRKQALGIFLRAGVGAALWVALVLAIP